MKTLRSKAFFTFAIILLNALCVFAQQQGDPIQTQFNIEAQKLIDAIVQVKHTNPPDADQQIRRIFNPRGIHTKFFGYALILALRPTREEYVRKIEDARIDKQVGASAANSGSTSLVSKGSIPSILGLAVENGALQKDVSGTTVTFRGNWVGIIKALGDKGYIESYDDDDATTRFLRRASFAVSFDTSRGNQNGTFTASQQQLSAYSFRFDIYNKRDPRHPSYTKKWEDLIRNQGQALTQNLAIVASFFLPLGSNADPSLVVDPNLVTWLGSAQSALLAASEEQIDQIIRKEPESLRAVQLSVRAKTVIADFERNTNSYLENRGRLLQEVANGPIITFEYSNNRPGDTPNYSNFRLIGEFSPFKGKADLTTNASFSFLNDRATGANAGRARDFQLSSQLDVPLGDVEKLGPFVFTIAGKYQHLFRDLTSGKPSAATTKGDIGIGQLKLTIPVKGSGVKIPISVSFANRTELIKESHVRGNVGVTFDLDSIFARLKP